MKEEISLNLINLHNFYYKEIDDWYQVYNLQSEDNILYTDKITIVNIYLPKLYETCYNKNINELDELERVLLTLYSEDVAKAKEFGGEIKVMEEYVDEASKVSLNEELKEVYDVEKEYTTLGRNIGREEGQLLKQQEIAMNMLNEKIDENLISKVTNLTLDEINSLKENTEN